MLSSLAYPPVGRWLKARRDVLGHSLSQVSNQLHMSEATLLLLESERFPELPEPAFAQGYLRRYATYLRLNPAEVAAMFDDWMAIHQAQNRTDSTRSVTPAKAFFPARHRSSRTGQALDAVLRSQAGQITAAAVCLGVLSFFLSQGAGMTSSSAAPTPRELVTQTLPELPQASTRPVAALESPRRAHHAGPTAVAAPRHWLIASETTHVHVTDHRGLIVFSGLVKQGQPVRLSGVQPFDIQAAKEGTVSLINDQDPRNRRQILANR